MIIGDRLRALREQKNLSQGQSEKRTGLLRCYISRVENRHTVPSIETLEKMSRALEGLYQLFYEGDNPSVLPKFKSVKTPSWGSSGKEARLMAKIHGNPFFFLSKFDCSEFCSHGSGEWATCR